jgi:ribosomal protein S18 acetylase RimI-like enzyme
MWRVNWNVSIYEARHMDVTFAFLKEEQFPEIYSAFMEAFADYHLDASYITETVLFNRAIKNAVDYETSVGVFAGTKMVGFTLIGIDHWKGVPAAFDAGTGIIPAYRGRGIAKQMFDFAIPKLKQLGIEKFILEVLQVNEPAVKAYQKAGFEITREFDCFQLEIAKVKASEELLRPLIIKQVGKETLGSLQRDLEWEPSWENSFASIERIPDEVIIYGSYDERDIVGILVYYPLLNWIVSILVRREYRRKRIATGLLSHFIHNLSPHISLVKLVNADHSDEGLRAFLDKTGFEFEINQFEMEYTVE